MTVTLTQAALRHSKPDDSRIAEKIRNNAVTQCSKPKTYTNTIGKSKYYNFEEIW